MKAGTLFRSATALAAGMLVAGGIIWAISDSGAATLQQPKAVDIAAGAALYQANCAECHGKDLEGQADWRAPGEDGLLPAPPHDETGHTWHHGDMLLFTYTKLGGAETLALQGMEFESGMPGFGDSLSDQEIWNILAFIKSTWTDRIREIQSARTEAERLQEGN